MQDDDARVARLVDKALTDIDRRLYRRAAEALDEALRRRPDRVDYAVHRARVTYHAGIGNLREMGAAEAQLRACLARDPNVALAYRYLGLIALHTGRREEAAAAWRRCLELDPEDEVARRGLSDSRKVASPVRRRLYAALGKLLGRSY